MNERFKELIKSGELAPLTDVCIITKSPIPEEAVPGFVSIKAWINGLQVGVYGEFDLPDLSEDDVIAFVHKSRSEILEWYEKR